MIVTQLEPVTYSFKLVATDSVKSQYDKALNSLTLILVKFQEWNDPLSLRLFKWGEKVLSIKLEEILPLEEILLEQTKKRIEKLISKILINPIDGATLQNPVLDRIWILEKWMLDDYQNLGGFQGGISPFDGEAITVKTHDFAIAMLKWVESFKLEETVLSSDLEPQELQQPLLSRELITVVRASHATNLLDRSVSSCKTQPTYQKLRFMFYLNQAKKHAQLEKEKQKKTKWKADCRKMVLLREQIQRWQIEHQEKVKNQFQQLESEVSQEIQETKHFHHLEREHLSSRLNIKEREILYLKEENQEIKHTNEANAEEIRQLRQEYSRISNEVQELRNRDSGGCIIL